MSVEAVPGAPMQIGYYASAHKSTCSPAPSPIIQIINAPKSGLLIIRRALLTTEKIAGCPHLKIPAEVAFYQARRGSTGTDHLSYKVMNEAGEVATFDVTITIKEAPRQPAPPMGSKI